jgi:hypothetical protein
MLDKQKVQTGRGLDESQPAGKGPECFKQGWSIGPLLMF